MTAGETVESEAVDTEVSEEPLEGVSQGSRGSATTVAEHAPCAEDHPTEPLEAKPAQVPPAMTEGVSEVISVPTEPVAPPPVEPAEEEAVATEPEGMPAVVEPVDPPSVAVEPAPDADPEAPAEDTVELAKAPPPPPVLASVEPSHGPLSGVAVAIHGDGFVEGSLIRLDAVELTTSFESAKLLRATTPARPLPATVSLSVVNPDGQSATLDDAFTFDPAPTIAGTEPTVVPVEGSVIVTIVGADFAEGCTVAIDGNDVPVSRIHACRLEIVPKAHEVGEVDLSVKNPDGQLVLRAAALRFAERPVVLGVTPKELRLHGGDTVRIQGRAFEDGAVVVLGGESIGAATFVSDTELSFIAPPRTSVGTVDVAVANPTGLSHRLPSAVAYVTAPPLLLSVEPTAGPNAGGTRVVLRGEDFVEGCSVYVCGIPTETTFRSSSEVELRSPAVSRDGWVAIRIVNPDDKAAEIPRAFRYDAPSRPPVITALCPDHSPQAGGTKLTITGEDFGDGAVVRFGAIEVKPASLSSKAIDVIAPSSPVTGTVTVQVMNPDGAAAAIENAFTYEGRPAPVITGIQPTNGSTLGGTKVLIEGLHFTRDAVVYIGREHPKDQVIKSAEEIQIITAPRKMAGVVDVEVVVPGATPAVMKNGFRYDASPAPTITSVSPNAGKVAGGDEMSVAGKNYTKDTIVLVDGKSPKAVKLVTPTTLEFKTPPGEAGKMVDVVVRNPDGKEAVQKRAFLYDPRYR